MKKIPQNHKLPSRYSACTWVSPQGKVYIWFPDGNLLYRVNPSTRTVADYTGTQEAQQLISYHFCAQDWDYIVMSGVPKWAYRLLCACKYRMVGTDLQTKFNSTSDDDTLLDSTHDLSPNPPITDSPPDTFESLLVRYITVAGRMMVLVYQIDGQINVFEQRGDKVILKSGSKALQYTPQQFKDKNWTEGVLGNEKVRPVFDFLLNLMSQQIAKAA